MLSYFKHQSLTHHVDVHNVRKEQVNASTHMNITKNCTHIYTCLRTDTQTHTRYYSKCYFLTLKNNASTTHHNILIVKKEYCC